MGPAATVDIFDRIVRATPVRRDQDHIHLLIVNDPAIPDRTAAILHGGEDPTRRMQAGIDKLAAMGASWIAIPCNTAHHYLPALQKAAPIPLLDMIGETVATIRRAHPTVLRIGVLATSGTLAVGLYQQRLKEAELTPIEPTADETERMMDAIYGPRGVKSAGATDEARAGLRAVGQALIERGAEALILGCTEIPLALHDGDLPVPLIASSQALAEAAVRVAFAGK